jgi:GxxExxY protein
MAGDREIKKDYREDKLMERIIECVIEVHKTLGPGFVESVYRRALVIELRARGLKVETEKEVIVTYKGHEAGRHRLDVLVEGARIVELKTVEALNKNHYAQLRSCMKATRLPVALLVNFATPMADYRRLELEP